jgi:hypothetical protein
MLTSGTPKLKHLRHRVSDEDSGKSEKGYIQKISMGKTWKMSNLDIINKKRNRSELRSKLLLPAGQNNENSLLLSNQKFKM